VRIDPNPRLPTWSHERKSQAPTAPGRWTSRDLRTGTQRSAVDKHDDYDDILDPFTPQANAVVRAELA